MVAKELPPVPNQMFPQRQNWEAHLNKFQINGQNSMTIFVESYAPVNVNLRPPNRG